MLFVCPVVLPVPFGDHQPGHAAFLCAAINVSSRSDAGILPLLFGTPHRPTASGIPPTRCKSKATTIWQASKITAPLLFSTAGAAARITVDARARQQTAGCFSSNVTRSINAGRNRNDRMQFCFLRVTADQDFVVAGIKNPFALFQIPFL